MEYLEGLLSLVANAAILIFEFIGVGIIIYAGLTGFLRFVRRAPDTKIYLAKGLAGRPYLPDSLGNQRRGKDRGMIPRPLH